jgi:hypothetical protein
MTALVQALSRFGSTNVETETLKLLAIFCGAGLLVSIVLATYGLDLSPGFFWKPFSLAHTQTVYFDRRRVAMDILAEVVPSESAVSRGKSFDQLLKIGFFTTISVATIGWVSAFGWVIVRVASWLLA